MPRPRLALAPLACLLACFATGCLDVDNEWTLNPDGSGKVHHRVVFNQKVLSFGGEKSPRQFARELLEKSEGIAAWGELSYGKTDEGYLRFEGVAYFPDASQVRLEHEVVKTRFRREGEELIASFTGDEGSLGIEGLLGEGGRGVPKSESLSGFRMSLRMTRMQLGSMKAFLKGRDRVRLPGKLAPGHAGKLSDGALEVAFSYERLTEFLDAVEKDPQLLEILRSHGSSKATKPEPEKAKEFQQLSARFMVGGEATEARSKGGEAAFDYAAAVKAAKVSAAKSYDALGYAVPGRPGKPLARFELSAVEYVREESADALNFDYPGDFAPHVRFHFLGLLGEEPVKLLGGRLTRVVATDGTSLLLEQKAHDLQAQFGESKRLFTLGTIARLTSSCAGGYEEISGYVEYLRASGRTEEVDLGFAAFTKGAKGTKFGAKLDELDPTGSIQLQLEGVDEGELAGFTLVDAQGQAFPLADDGGWSVGSQLTRSLRPEKQGVPWPAKGKLIVSLHRGRTRHRVPFKLTELDAQGLPRGN